MTSGDDTKNLLQLAAQKAGQIRVPERREFLRTGVAAAAVGIASMANSSSLGFGVGERPYGRPSEFTDLQRRTVPWLTATPHSAISFTPLQDLKGIITPNGLHFERYRSGVPSIDPDNYQLMIHGLVDQPKIFTLHDLQRMPSVSEIRFIECAANGGMEWRGPQMESLQFTHGMIACSEWTGVRLSTLLEQVGLQNKAAWILAEGADAAGMTRSIPIDKALDDTLICYAQNGEPLRPEQGFPVRMMNPGWEGSTSIKWLRRLEVGDQPWHHREETSRYSDLMADGRARQFSFVQEANSVVTFPCPEKPLMGHGRFEIEGLAWSGRGTIKAVDLSFDGGRNWQTAQLKGPVLPKSLTRFSVQAEFSGQPWLLQSRAIDETGYVQPTLDQLRAVRGSNSNYHKNAIHTWHVDSEGAVRNVQAV